MKFGLVLLAAVAALATTPAEGAIRPHSFFFHPHGGVYDFHEDEAQKDAPVYGLGLGYRFSPHWSSEVITSFIDSESKSGGEQVDGYLLRWEAQYNFFPESRFVPYLAAGIGGLLLDERGGESDLDGVVGYGMGVQAFMTDRLALRLDGRHLLTMENRRLEGREFNNLMASAGLVVAVGGEKERPELIDTDGDGVIEAFDRCLDTPLGVPVDGYGCPADGDLDGIPDHQDRCPGTATGEPVDANGCSRDRRQDSDGDGIADTADQCPQTPAGAKVDETGCPLPAPDTDGDGVEDSLDKCPATPAGVRVDTAGCPRDSDGDGIADGEDLCPDTAPGTSVDSRGCAVDGDQDGVPDAADRCPDTGAGVSVDVDGCPPAAVAQPQPQPQPQERAQSLTIQLDFPRGESSLGTKNQERLRAAVDFVRSHPEQRLVVEGHTDSIGPAEANHRLSNQRAENVRRFLVDEAQADPERITVEAYGETRPMAPNSTPEGRVQNRRVVVRVAGE